MGIVIAIGVLPQHAHVFFSTRSSLVLQSRADDILYRGKWMRGAYWT